MKLSTFQPTIHNQYYCGFCRTTHFEATPYGDYDNHKHLADEAAAPMIHTHFVQVYKTAEGTQLNATQGYDFIHVVGKGLPLPHMADADSPNLYVFEQGYKRVNLYQAKYDLKTGKLYYIERPFGGNFAYSSYSGWPNAAAVHIHDYTGT